MSWCILALALLVTPASAATFAGRVTSVTDGDTFRMRDLRVGIWGIDAPERGERGAESATRALRALVAEQQVTCHLRDWGRFGGAVAQCFAGGSDIGAVLLRAGLGVEFCRYSGGHYGRC
jgi:endonuclease YncB( thermonuclease family)